MFYIKTFFFIFYVEWEFMYQQQSLAAGETKQQYVLGKTTDEICRVKDTVGLP